ncbi:MULTISPECIES: rhomboid family intramembrane serine protease [Burkholderia]|nr:rhomboid family intramembrane serine protease [Burkholderia aenigmatica]
MLTCGRLHAGLAHVSFNKFGLYMFGPDVERVLGHARSLCRGRHVTGT